MIDWASFFIGMLVALAVVVVVARFASSRAYEAMQERHQREVLAHNSRLAESRDSALRDIVDEIKRVVDRLDNQ